MWLRLVRFGDLEIEPECELNLMVRAKPDSAADVRAKRFINRQRQGDNYDNAQEAVKRFVAIS